MAEGRPRLGLGMAPLAAGPRDLCVATDELEAMDRGMRPAPALPFLASSTAPACCARRPARALGPLRALLFAFVLGGCGKFRQANECELFVKTVNAWLAETRAPAKGPVPTDPKQIAKESRALAQRYDELGASLWSLKLESDELAPRARRYREIAKRAAVALRGVADDLDREDLDAARKKRVEFDTIARSEGPLVQEINSVCR